MKNVDIPSMIGFVYENSEGEVTSRMVKFHAIESEGNGIWYLNGFCHLAWRLRTFRIDRIIDTIIDIETGEVIDVHDWMERITGVRPDISEFKALREKTQQIRKSRESRGPCVPRPVQTGKGVLFTGFKAADRAALEAMVPQVGWHVRKSMSSTVDIVVAGYNAGLKKVQEALDNGIAVVSEKVFREMCAAAQKFENEE